jgi:hypothetical protein
MKHSARQEGKCACNQEAANVKALHDFSVSFKSALARGDISRRNAAQCQQAEKVDK